MPDQPNDNRRGRILLVILGIIALIFIVASLTSNLSAWQQADEAAGVGESLPEETLE